MARAKTKHFFKLSWRKFSRKSRNVKVPLNVQSSLHPKSPSIKYKQPQNMKIQLLTSASSTLKNLLVLSFQVHPTKMPIEVQIPPFNNPTHTKIKPNSTKQRQGMWVCDNGTKPKEKECKVINESYSSSYKLQRLHESNLLLNLSSFNIVSLTTSHPEKVKHTVWDERLSSKILPDSLITPRTAYQKGEL